MRIFTTNKISERTIQEYMHTLLEYFQQVRQEQTCAVQSGVHIKCIFATMHDICLHVHILEIQIYFVENHLMLIIILCNYKLFVYLVKDYLLCNSNRLCEGHSVCSLSLP
jgi:hypothetical protein